VEFDLRLPDSTTRSGQSASDGFLRFSGITTPGTATIILPEHDQEKGSTSGPKTSGAALYRAGGVEVQVGQSTVVELQPRVYRGRLTGLLFDTDRTFVLPGALDGIRLIRRLYEEHPETQVLISGHADSMGGAAYNRDLSSERADAVAAYLTDDVDGWLAWYRGKPSSHRWGTREDQYMLAAIRDGGGAPYYAGPVSDGGAPDVTEATRRFQSDQGLAVDGVAGDDTRRALIQKYMAADGTTLPPGTVIKTHGCGESHPADPIGDSQDDAENRRVEVFLFEGPIDPEPVASCPVPAGCAQYGEWVAHTVQSVELHHQPDAVTVTIIDQDDQPIAGATVHLSGATSAEGTTGSDGRAQIDDLAPGHYVVIGKKAGFDDGSAEVDVDSSGSAVQLRILPPIDWSLFSFDVTLADPSHVPATEEPE